MQLYEKANTIQPCQGQARHTDWKTDIWNFLLKVYSSNSQLQSNSMGAWLLKSKHLPLFPLFKSLLGLIWCIKGQYQNVASDVNLLYMHTYAQGNGSVFWVSEAHLEIIDTQENVLTVYTCAAYSL